MFFFSAEREKLSICLAFPFHIFISLHVRTSPAESQNKNVRSLVQSWSRASVGTNWCLSLYQPFVQGWLTHCLIANKLWMWGNNLPEWVLLSSCGFLNSSLYEGAEFLLEKFFSVPDFTGVHLGRGSHGAAPLNWWVLLTCTWKLKILVYATAWAKFSVVVMLLGTGVEGAHWKGNRRIPKAF